GHQIDLAFQDIDELVLGGVPVALRGRGSRRQADQVDAEMAEADGVPQGTLLAPAHRLAKGLGIAAALAAGTRRGIDAGRWTLARVAHDLPLRVRAGVRPRAVRRACWAGRRSCRRTLRR